MCLLSVFEVSSKLILLFLWWQFPSESAILIFIFSLVSLMLLAASARGFVLFKWLQTVVAFVCCLFAMSVGYFIVFYFPADFFFSYYLVPILCLLYICFFFVFAVALVIFFDFLSALSVAPFFHTLMFLFPRSPILLSFYLPPVSAMHLGNATGYGFRS